MRNSVEILGLHCALLAFHRLVRARICWQDERTKSHEEATFVAVGTGAFE